MTETDLLVVGSGAAHMWAQSLPGRPETGSFYAMKLIPGDIGTFLGRRADSHARVLDGQGSPIPGLLAAGNDITSIMGGTFPGAGITIGPALTFGYIAARHAASAGR